MHAASAADEVGVRGRETTTLTSRDTIIANAKASAASSSTSCSTSSTSTASSTSETGGGTSSSNSSSSSKPRNASGRRRDVFVNMIAGGTAGAVSRTCVAPLDRMKILFQTQTDPPKYRGVAHALRVIHAEEGLLGLWRGNFANCFRIIPKTAVQYGSFVFWRPLFDSLMSGEDASNSKATATTKKKAKTSLGKMMSAGMAAGLTAQIATYPLDTIRARLTVDSTGKLDGMMDAFRTVVKDEGLVALYKGIIPTLCGSVPYVGIEFSVYGLLKQTSFVPKKKGSEELTVPGKLFCGASAAMVGQTITYPFDLVRRRMQVAGYSQNMRKYKGVFDAFRSILKTEGFLALYKGLFPNYLKSVPAVAITWAVYEEMVRVLK